ncbi:uncharacterized protein TNIN_322081 [Trichonephila inaurata madagascariensis]|uniref:Uncharacterized protein n=1 Tax=Trichonephila inaurata madagascariensis TaxID=2747483 RepID=A0A8X6XQX9_9ARAC|nr:uncharacterized protein TNIN_322081 [Trichonephila inaurata madagascariensis]
MDCWLENGSSKKTDVVSSNAEITQSTDTGILEPAIHQLPVPYSSSFIFHLYHLSIFDRWYRRKDVNMILVTCRLDLLVLVTRRLQMWSFALKQNIGKQLLSTSKTTKAFGKKSPYR